MTHQLVSCPEQQEMDVGGDGIKKGNRHTHTQQVVDGIGRQWWSMLSILKGGVWRRETTVMKSEDALDTQLL